MLVLSCQEVPTVDVYKNNVLRLWSMIHEKFPSCPIAVVTIPILGEALNSAYNELVLRYNHTLIDATQSYQGKNLLHRMDLNQELRR